MEVPAGGRRSRDMSSLERNNIKICTHPQQQQQQQIIQPTRIMRPTFKRVQVVYYLSRNGQLEHPHYMELSHLAAHQLRLKDFIDRLTALRGKAMPSLYSWSCKRSYKNGYVWNDLAEHDIIYPSEGAEYILKGSEVIVDGTTGKFQQQVQLENSNFHPRRKPSNNYENVIEAEENDEENEEDLEVEEYEEKIRYSYATTTAAPVPTQRRCSKGVSTDGLHDREEEEEEEEEEEQQQQQQTSKNPTTEINLENSSSPPSTTSSSLSDKGVHENSNAASKRFEDGDPVINEPLLSRNSMLFQLIACGGSLSFRGKNLPPVEQQTLALPTTTTTMARRSTCSDLHKGVFYKSVSNKVDEEEEEEDDDEIKCMSENPRFGNLQSEEKEYFSGSIVESISNAGRAHVEPSSLKKSSSYNEERGSKSGMGREAAGGATKKEEEMKREKASTSKSKSKCIPRMMMKPSCSKLQQSKK